MADIILDLGLTEHKFSSSNGQISVLYNSTDIAYIERIFTIFDELDAKQTEFSNQIDKAKDNAAVFEIAREMDKSMREDIDGVFGCEVCAAVFGSMSVYALAAGLPLWCNLMLSVIDEMDSAFAREKKATNPRIQKWMAKYNKKKPKGAG